MILAMNDNRNSRIHYSPELLRWIEKRLPTETAKTYPLVDATLYSDLIIQVTLKFPTITAERARQYVNEALKITHTKTDFRLE